MNPRKKTFEEIIHRFRDEIVREYNIRDGLLKITLSPELFNQHIMELSEKSNIRPSCISMNSVAGIEIRAGYKGDA